ncbi:MAG: archaeal cell division control protein 6 [Candidatus Woesearchaeota archaeon]|nr:archaeal cell division control protein 6 [Candidatus Woesearchaeota archaeon]
MIILTLGNKIYYQKTLKSQGVLSLIMGLFDDILHADETLFKNPVALDFDYIPKRIPFRENEQRIIVNNIKPLFLKRNGRNVFIYGSPGIGKTVAVKKVLEELEEKTDEIVPIYVNCWQKNTSYKIFLEICNQLDYKFTHNKNSEELFGVIKKILNQKAAVFVFDEIDRAEDVDFLYSLLEEIYLKVIILITNFQETIANFDSRIKSRLLPEIVEFKPYSLRETFEILRERAEYAFYPGVISDEILQKIAEIAYKVKDVRTGLFLMRESGNFAEARSSRRIEVVDFKKAAEKLSEFSIKSKESLSEDEKLIFEIIKEMPESKIGDLYKEYVKRGGKGVYKTFQRKINKLEKNNFITVDKIEGGKEGKTSIIKANEVDKKLTDFR